MILALDYETQSAASIDDGASAYAEHETTSMLCAVFKLADHQRVYEASRWTPSSPLPAWVVRHVKGGGLLLAHNASFELSINRYVMGPRHEFPDTTMEQWRDTLQHAAVLGLPLSLAGLGAAIGAKVQKDDEGHKLMLQLSAIRKSRKGELVYPDVTPEKLTRLLDYCETDVDSMIECWRRLPPLPPEEIELQAIDRKINARGVLLDFDFAAKMRTLAARRREEISAETWRETQDLIDVSSPAALMSFARDRGVVLPKVRRTRSDGTKHVSESIDRASIAELLDSDLPPDVRKALELRVEAGRVTSLAKLGRLDAVCNSDGRARWLLRYALATTGRWASEILQLHNLPRATKAFKRVAEAALSAARTGDFDTLSCLHPVLEALSFLLRALVVARPGHRLIGGDYASVEARIVAWLAGQTDTLALFASGADVYTADAKAIGSDSRDLGKASRLGLGFQMGAVKFMSAAGKAGVTLTPGMAKHVVTAWRKANPKIVQFWKDLDEGFAIAHREKTVVAVGEHLLLRGTKEAVQLILPSGRALHYWRPFERPCMKRIEIVNDEGEIESREIETVEQRYFTRRGAQMVVEGTYGGHLAENATQATARDLLRDALRRFDRTPYDIVLHVHDSAVAEVPLDFGSVPEFASIMAEVPSWAPGLPVAVDGYTSGHFRG